MNDANPLDISRDHGHLTDLVERILLLARRAGADAAEVSASEDAGLSVSVRMGELETVEFNRDKGFGIAVYFDGHKGTASTSDTTVDAVEATVAAACNIARFTAADPCNGLADPHLMAREIPDLDLSHPWPLSTDEACAMALAAEAKARAHDARIVNSEGAGISTHQSLFVYGNSHGFLGRQIGTRHGLSCAVIAADAKGMQRDHWFTVARRRDQLDAPEAVGDEAARRAVARLGARTVATGRFPVLFAPEVSGGLIGHLIGALSGGALYRRASFLLDSIGRALLPAWISVVERPRRRGGLSSTAFDAEGVATYDKAFIDAGVVASYVLGSYSARRLGMVTTANAGGVHNLSVVGKREPATTLLARMQRGLLVTELMGQGVNTVTGDYSRGAAGFWIEDGAIAYPVAEVTIAGNLSEMLGAIVGLGDDLDARFNVQSGSMLIESMMVAGD
jgi:PmbA protein